MSNPISIPSLPLSSAPIEIKSGGRARMKRGMTVGSLQTLFTANVAQSTTEDKLRPRNVKRLYKHIRHVSKEEPIPRTVAKQISRPRSRSFNDGPERERLQQLVSSESDSSSNELIFPESTSPTSPRGKELKLQKGFLNNKRGKFNAQMREALNIIADKFTHEFIASHHMPAMIEFYEIHAANFAAILPKELPLEAVVKLAVTGSEDIIDTYRKNVTLKKPIIDELLKKLDSMTRVIHDMQGHKGKTTTESANKMLLAIEGIKAQISADLPSFDFKEIIDTLAKEEDRNILNKLLDHPGVLLMIHGTGQGFIAKYEIMQMIVLAYLPKQSYIWKHQPSDKYNPLNISAKDIVRQFVPDSSEPNVVTKPITINGHELETDNLGTDLQAGRKLFFENFFKKICRAGLKADITDAEIDSLAEEFLVAAQGSEIENPMLNKILNVLRMACVGAFSPGREKLEVVLSPTYAQREYIWPEAKKGTSCTIVIPQEGPIQVQTHRAFGVWDHHENSYKDSQTDPSFIDFDVLWTMYWDREAGVEATLSLPKIELKETVTRPQKYLNYAALGIKAL